jgi:outer membrane protein OmpA-like peptidoglycan-associated protein/tetratricopeptide (TPR) repeat protein
MKNYLLILSVLACISSSLGQNKADDYYDAGYFKEASVIYEKELSKERGDTEMIQHKLANSYFHVGNFSSSLKVYKSLSDAGVNDSITLIRMAEINRMMCKYEEAKKYYSKYQETLGSKQDDKPYTDLLEDRVVYPKNNNSVNDAIKIDALNLPKVNKGMGYTFMENGDIIAGIEQENEETKTTFTTLGIISHSSDLKEVSEYEFNKETPFFNAYPSYCSETKTIYYTANVSSKKKSFKNDKNVLQVYSLDTESTQDEPKLLQFNLPNYNFTHPSISKDGKRLYFVSDIPGGHGGYDVYFVDKLDDGWSDLKNCGKDVNSKYDELTPFITGDSLFYSSYGHENYGGSDVFLSISGNDGFSDAKNLGMPINSCMNDFSFVMTDEAGRAILTSNRNSLNSGKDDIYEVLIPLSPNTVVDNRTNNPIEDVAVLINDKEEILTNDKGEWSERLSIGDSVNLKFDNPYYETKVLEFTEVSKNDIEEIKDIKLEPIMIEGRVVDDITSQPIEGTKVTLYEKNGDGEWELVDTKKSDEEGKWEFHVRKDREYKVVFDKDEYITHNEIVPKYDDANEMRNEVLSRMNPFSMKYEAKKDLVIQIDNIYFDFNSSYIQKQSYPVLDKLKGFLDDNPDVKVELSAHTDCLGKDDYNLWLSGKRAVRSKNYLVKAGISSDRIEAKGYGEQRMIVKDCELQKRNDKEAQKNRRVEVKIL